MSDSTCSTAARFSGSVEPLARLQLAFKRGGYVSAIMNMRALPGMSPTGGTPGGRLVEQGDTVRQGAVLARVRDTDYRVKLEQARAQLAQATAARDQARHEHERAAQLYASQATPGAALDGALSKLAAAEAQVQAATALVAEANLAIEDCVLRAPTTAVLSKRLVEVGSLVAAGTPAFVLADTTSMRVIFGAPDIILDRFRAGVALDVTVEALGPGPLVGRVASIAPIADPKSRLFDVEVLLPNPDGRLRAGMIASLRTHPEREVALRPMVPLAALVRPPGSTKGFAVFVVDGAVARVRRIEPGELCSEQVELVGGLRAGEQVLVDGASQAFDGETVLIVR